MSFIEELVLNKYNFSENALRDYNQYRESRSMEFVVQKFTDGPGFRSDNWRRSFQKNRRIICRTTWHGYHHLLCLQGRCFNIDGCVCRYSGDSNIDRTHILTCTYFINVTLSEKVRMLISLDEEL